MKEDVAQKETEKAQTLEKNEPWPFKVYSRMPKGQEENIPSCWWWIAAAEIVETKDTYQEDFIQYLKEKKVKGESSFSWQN